MRFLSVFLAFLLVLSSIPASAAQPEKSAPAAAPAASGTAPAPQPTLHEMLAKASGADFTAGDRPQAAAVATLAPGQEATETKEKKSHKTLWIVLGCVAGAAVIWAIADSGGSDNGSGGGGGGY